MPLLFSYGTLQQHEVQRATFSRLLTGRADELVGYTQTLFETRRLPSGARDEFGER